VSSGEAVSSGHNVRKLYSTHRQQLAKSTHLILLTPKQNSRCKELFLKCHPKRKSQRTKPTPPDPPAQKPPTAKRLPRKTPSRTAWAATISESRTGRANPTTASLLTRLFAEFQPKTTLEQELVNSLAQHRWLVQRAIRLQEGCFHTDLAYCDAPETLAIHLRYQTTHERAASKALRELQNLQQQRKKEEIGFVSQKDAEAARTRVQEQHELSKQLKQTTLRLQFARVQRVEADNLRRQVTCAPAESAFHAPNLLEFAPQT
jgi:hypothetical protein